MKVWQWRWLTLKVNSTRLPTSLVLTMADSPITVPPNCFCTTGFSLVRVRQFVRSAGNFSLSVSFASSHCIYNQRRNSHAEGGWDDVFNQQGDGQSGQVILLADTEDATRAQKLGLLPELEVNVDNWLTWVEELIQTTHYLPSQQLPTAFDSDSEPMSCSSLPSLPPPPIAHFFLPFLPIPFFLSFLPSLNCPPFCSSSIPSSSLFTLP